jgi:ATP-dependent Clp protease ATP-binding subunit ClpC
VFERFTDRARRVLVYSQELAVELGHEFIGCEHVLFGLTRAEGVGATVLEEVELTSDVVRAEILERVGDARGRAVSEADALAALGIDLDVVRSRLEETFGEGALPEPDQRQPPFTPKAKALLERSLIESLGLLHDYIGTEHLLLAVFGADGNVAEAILTDRGVTASQVRQRALELAAPDNLRITGAEATLSRLHRRLLFDKGTPEEYRAIAQQSVDGAAAARQARRTGLADLVKKFADDMERVAEDALDALGERGLELG